MVACEMPNDVVQFTELVAALSQILLAHFYTASGSFQATKSSLISRSVTSLALLKPLRPLSLSSPLPFKLTKLSLRIPPRRLESLLPSLLCIDLSWWPLSTVFTDNPPALPGLPSFRSVLTLSPLP